VYIQKKIKYIQVINSICKFIHFLIIYRVIHKQSNNIMIVTKIFTVNLQETYFSCFDG